MNTLLCPQDLVSGIIYLWSKNILGFVWRFWQELRDCGDGQDQIMMGVNKRIFMFALNTKKTFQNSLFAGEEKNIEFRVWGALSKKMMICLVMKIDSGEFKLSRKIWQKKVTMGIGSAGIAVTSHENGCRWEFRFKILYCYSHLGQVSQELSFFASCREIDSNMDHDGKPIQVSEEQSEGKQNYQKGAQLCMDPYPSATSPLSPP